MTRVRLASFPEPAIGKLGCELPRDRGIDVQLSGPRFAFFAGETLH